MGTKLTNNATGRLAVSLTAASTQLSMVVGDAVKFPTIAAGSGDNFPLTAVKANGELEIMLCTLTNGNVFTVQRGQEGTSPKAFSAGDRIELRLTAGTIDGMIDDRIDAAIEVVLEDLGTAAYADLTTSPLDTTAGRALKVGDFGLGTTTPPELQRKDDYAQSVAQFFTVSGADVPTAWGQDGASTGGVIMPRANRPVALYFGNNNKLKISHFGGSSWSDGAEFYHSGNKPNWSDINEKPNLVETSRTITAGTGLTGGGTLADDRTLSVNFGTAADTAAQGNDSRIEGAAQKSNNLSDLTNAATARDNLGLGNAATRNVGTSSGQLMEVGAFGLGSVSAYDPDITLEAQHINGFGTALHGNRAPSDAPDSDIGKVLYVGHADWGTQLWFSCRESKVWFRNKESGKPYESWKEFIHSGSSIPWNSIEGKPSTFTPPTDAGGVGTYAWVSYSPRPPSSVTWGGTIAGSSINPVGGGLGPKLAGTWRVMGARLGTQEHPGGQPINASFNLAVRIS